MRHVKRARVVNASTVFDALSSDLSAALESDGNDHCRSDQSLDDPGSGSHSDSDTASPSASAFVPRGHRGRQATLPRRALYTTPSSEQDLIVPSADSGTDWTDDGVDTSNDIASSGLPEGSEDTAIDTPSYAMSIAEDCYDGGSVRITLHLGLKRLFEDHFFSIENDRLVAIKALTTQSARKAMGTRLRALRTDSSEEAALEAFEFTTVDIGIPIHSTRRWLPPPPRELLLTLHVKSKNRSDSEVLATGWYGEPAPRQTDAPTFAGLPCDNHRMVLGIAKRSREELGIPDVSVGLSAVPLMGATEPRPLQAHYYFDLRFPTTSEKHEDPFGTGKGAADIGSKTQLAAALLNSYPARLLVEAVVSKADPAAHIASRCRDASLLTLTPLIAMCHQKYQVSMLHNGTVLQCFTSANIPEARRWTRQTYESSERTQAALGRDAMRELEGCSKAADGWFDSVFDFELSERCRDALQSRASLRQSLADTTSSGEFDSDWALVSRRTGTDSTLFILVAETCLAYTVYHPIDTGCGVDELYECRHWRHYLAYLSHLLSKLYSNQRDAEMGR